MRRISLCALLSVALHAALLSLVSMPTRAPIAAPQSIRVALHPAPTPPAQKIDSTQQTKPAQKINQTQQTKPAQKIAPTQPSKPAQKSDQTQQSKPAQKSENFSDQGAAQKTQNISEQGPAQKSENFSDQEAAQKTEDLSSSAPAASATAAAPAIVELPDVVVTHRVQPDYPASSRRRRDEGTVVIVARVEGGRVVSLAVERSSGHPALDEAAVRAARGWRFSETPPFSVRMPFTFKIR